jgi:hypothetical protein
MDGPDEDDVVEQGGRPLPLPGWVRRPRWLPTLGWPPSRGAAILGIAGLIVGLAGGYALGYRQLRQIVPLSPAPAAGAGPSAVAVSPVPSAPGASTGAPGVYSLKLSIGGLSGLAQIGGECSVQSGRELQVGVEVLNLSGTPVTLGQIKPILPMGGLRLVSQQWAPCGAISSSSQAAEGTFIFAGASTGQGEEAQEAADAAALNAASTGVLTPFGSGWLSVTFRVLVACPHPLPVQFSVSFQENGRTDTTQLPGFPDLGQVAYSGCKVSS